jgi:Ca2+-binding RTX toxin-like protein
MNLHRIVNVRSVGMAAATAFAAGLVATGASAASAAQASEALVVNNSLVVIGTNAADDISMQLDPNDPNSLEVDIAGSPTQAFDRTTFDSITVLLANGSDHFTAGAGFADEVMRVDAGGGNDVIVTADGNDLILAGSGRDTVNTGAGNDGILGGTGQDVVDGDAGADVAFLQQGDDIFRWDPGDGSDVVEGGEGTDTLDFNGSDGNELMSLSANGTRSLFTRDLGNIRMDMSSVEQLDLTALGGTDDVTINDMTGTDFRRADVDLSASTGQPDGLADAVTVNGTNDADTMRVRASNEVVVSGLVTVTSISGQDTSDHLQVNTLDGHDTVRIDREVPAAIDVDVDLGAGQL